MPDKRTKLEELIELIQSYINGEKNDDDLNEFGNSLSIRTYIPLQEKIGILMLLLFRKSYSKFNSQEIFVGELYRNMFFYVLLQEYAMIDCSNSELITNQNYDLLFPFFNSFILQYCKEDYDLLREMLRDAINFNNIEKLINGFGQLDMEALMATSKSSEELIQKIENDKEVIQDLKDIALATDPNMSAIFEAIKNNNK